MVVCIQTCTVMSVHLTLLFLGQRRWHQTMVSNRLPSFSYSSDIFKCGGKKVLNPVSIVMKLNSNSNVDFFFQLLGFNKTSIS